MTDNLKPFYGRRRVRRLCDHIDSLKVMLGRAVKDRDAAKAESERLREENGLLQQAWDTEVESANDAREKALAAYEMEAEIERLREVLQRIADGDSYQQVGDSVHRVYFRRGGDALFETTASDIAREALHQQSTLGREEGQL